MKLLHHMRIHPEDIRAFLSVTETASFVRAAESLHITQSALSRRLQKLGYPVRFSNFRITNVLATCELPWGIKLSPLARAHPRQAQYEPELHPALVFRKPEPFKATLKVSTRVC